jgi:hypothetical protein
MHTPSENPSISVLLLEINTGTTVFTGLATPNLWQRSLMKTRQFSNYHRKLELYVIGATFLPVWLWAPWLARQEILQYTVRIFFGSPLKTVDAMRELQYEVNLMLKPVVNCYEPFLGILAPAKRYTKKPRQTLVSSSLDSLGLSAAVAHVFRLQKTSLMDSWGRGYGVCALYCRFHIKNKWKWTV